MRAVAIPRNWLFEVCWKLQPTQLPRSLSTGKPRAWPHASPLSRTFASSFTIWTSLAAIAHFSHRRSSSAHGGSCISLQIEHFAAENPAQSLAIPTSTAHATQRIPKKQSSRHAQSASNSVMRHACSVGCKALAPIPYWFVVSQSARSYYQLSYSVSLIYSSLALCSLNVSLAVSPACRTRFSHAGAPPSATVLSATALVFCVSVVPRAGVAVLVALMFRRTKARPACFMWSHVWAQNP
jgi:hypothetical protein